MAGRYFPSFYFAHGCPWHLRYNPITRCVEIKPITDVPACLKHSVGRFLPIGAPGPMGRAPPPTVTIGCCGIDV